MPASKVTKQQLLDDLNAGMSTYEIAEKHGYSDIASLWRAFKYRGIKWPHYAVGTNELTDNQYQLILGTMLGDGYIPKKNGRHTFLRLSQCLAQEEYLLWKVLVLRPWITPRGVVQETHLNKHIQLTASTYTHPVFTELRKKFYPNGKKIVSREILDELSDFALAVWFMDDGSCVNHNRRKLRFHTGGFTMEENQLIQKWFLDKYGAESTVPTCAGYPILCFYGDSAELIASVMEPHLIPSMLYKVGC